MCLAETSRNAKSTPGSIVPTASKTSVMSISVSLPLLTMTLSEQQQKLNEKLRGHYAYYGVTGNGSALSRFRHEVERRWRKWLMRRNRERKLNWTWFRRLLQRFPLAPVRTVHSSYRHAVNP